MIYKIIIFNFIYKHLISTLSYSYLNGDKIKLFAFFHILQLMYKYNA